MLKWITDNLRAVLAIVALVVIILVGLQLRSCQQARQQAAQSKVDRAQDDATLNSAADAIATQGEVAGNALASETLTAKNREEIQNAQGADDAVNPALRDAGLASLCRRPSFRNSPSGRVRCPPAP